MSDNTIELKEEFDPFAVILLIRWLQNNVKRPDGQAHTLDRIATDVLEHNNRHPLNRFLLEKLNTDEQANRAQEYALKLKPVLDQGRPFPPTIRELFESVYGETMSIGSSEDSKPVQLPEILRHRAMGRVPSNATDITPLVGLSALVRISDDNVPAPELGEDVSIPGWVISILNVLPDHVQTGLNHPLFMLRQRGLGSNTSVTIQGIVVTQDDRFIFHGIDVLQRRPFHAVLPVPERWSGYRDANANEPVYGSGMMMGLSSGREVFAGLIDLFAIPDTTLPADASETQKDRFRDRYREIVESKPGVYNLDKIVSELHALGIRGSTDWLKDILRDMRDRTEGKKLLKP